MSQSKPRGVPEGDYEFETPREATPLARAVSIVAAILEITQTRSLEDLESRLGESRVRGMLSRAHVTGEDRDMIAGNRGVLSLVANTTPKIRLVLCPECGAVYLSGAGGVPKTCQAGAAGCGGVPYVCTPANRVPHTGKQAKAGD